MGAAHALAAGALGARRAGVPYERVRLDLSAGEQKNPDFRAINPMAKVPALTNGPVYVAEAYPNAGLAPPLGDPARGRYLQWLFFSPSCVEPAFLTKSANIPVDPRMASFGDFDRVFDVLEAAVTSGSWLLGERFSAADVMIGLDLHFGDRYLQARAFAAAAARLCRPLPRPPGAPARRKSKRLGCKRSGRR